MSPIELAQKCNNELGLLACEYISAGTIPADQLQKGFIYLHTTTIYNLMNDILFLEGHPHTTIARCGVRPMMESLFNIGAAMRDEIFAPNKIAWENDHWFTKLESLAKHTLSAADGERLEAMGKQGSADLAEFVNRFKVGKIQNWGKIHKIAAVAKLDELYDRYYFSTCHHVHSNLVGILSYDSTSRGMTLRTATIVVATAIRFSGSYLHPSRTADYNKMTAEFIAILEELSVDGSYE